MFCKHCGAELPDGARFCTNCGRDLNAAEPVRPYMQYGGMDTRPSTYLALSIIVTSLCCTPLGIVGIVYAAQVDSAWNAGRYDEARLYSKRARNWSWWGIGIAAFWWILYLILVLAGVAASWWTFDEFFV